MTDLLEISPDVRAALDGGRPVVALESTLLTHGLPQARARTVAEELESAVRARGATPATIAIVDGRIQVGLSSDALVRLTAGDAQKASLRDLGAAVSGQGDFGTTVAATMCIAHRAGIRVFATGGIGGVHRGAAETFDESADLLALSRYPVAVVCAGAKAVLDLPKTLERLESLGVPVVGYQTDELPAFYTARSGLSVSHRADSAAELARTFDAQVALTDAGFLVVQAPPPGGPPGAEVDAWIAEAFERATRASVAGNALTPFLLSALAELSEGRLVEANVALVIQNAELAAELAVCL